MATYFARGGVGDDISTAEKREALAQALKVIGRPLRKVLVLPPDHTRLNSDAGELTRLLYKLLGPKTEVDIMPALGTHSPMSEAQLRMMFGDRIPLAGFLSGLSGTALGRALIPVSLGETYAVFQRHESA